MKKTNNGYVHLLTIVIFILLCACFYWIYNRVLKIDTNPITTTQASADINEENFLYHNTVDYELNDLNHKIRYKYYYYRCQDMLCDRDKTYYLSVIPYLDNKKILDSETIIYYGEENFLLASDVTMEIKTKIKLGANNIMTLKGNEKEYLVLNLPQDYNETIGSVRLLIINSAGIVLYSGEIKYDTLIHYRAENINKLYQNQFYIDNNKLYYLNYEQCKAHKYTITVANDLINKSNEILSIEEVSLSGTKC